jgi:hypothetical protein
LNKVCLVAGAAQGLAHHLLTLKSRGAHRDTHLFAMQEFGKTKLYVPLQDGLAELSAEVRSWAARLRALQMGSHGSL